jgi:amino acid adenylation domain-containing protein
MHELTSVDSDIAQLARSLPGGESNVEVRPFTLMLDQQQIEAIACTVPGGADNVQDIYPLSPLQEGMLFHSLLSHRSDTYLLSTLFELASAERARALASALQKVIDRHDVLRTAVLWEGVSRPVQVVYRRAELQIEELRLGFGNDAIEALRERMKPQHQRLELERAPLMRLLVASVSDSAQCYGLLQLHHLICDHQSLRVLVSEVMECLRGREDQLPAPVPYRRYIAQAGVDAGACDSNEFFKRKLAAIDEPTAPFGLLDVHGDGTDIEESRQVLDSTLVRRIRSQQERRAVSAARLFHAAWSLVVARTSGREDVVFGTVLLAAAQRQLGAQRMLGLSVNTLPLRLRLHEATADDLVQQVHRELIELTQHETTPLTQALRASGLGASPLFTSILNFRRGAAEPEGELATAPGIKVLARGEAWTNYPFTVTVDDAGDTVIVMAKTNRAVGPQRVIDYLCTALQSLLEALEAAPDTPALALEVLPPTERHRVIHASNETQVPFPHEKLIHELFEQQAASVPQAVAVTHGARSLTYRELNAQANQLARYLRSRGIGPDQLVGICLDRSVEMLIGLLAVLKAGGAYIPLDPGDPVERLEHILKDGKPRVLLTAAARREALPRTAAEIIALDAPSPEIARQRSDNLNPKAVELNARNLAYVIYTSGSTGRPKGVMIEHRSLVNYAIHAQRQFDIAAGNGSLVCSSFSFDLMLTGLYPTLIAGKTVHLCDERHGLPDLCQEVLRRTDLAPVKLTPSHLTLLNDLLRDGQLVGRVRALVLGGEPLQADVVRLWQEHARGTRIFNHYGPTEATIGCVVNEVVQAGTGTVPVGRPISNARIYILNGRGQPTPIGAVGEIHIGGIAVARGYLNQAELTAERFIRDPFSNDPQARMYRTGDLARWRDDGMIEFLGRNDQQVKIRGFRIELGAIESALVTHPQLREAAVIAREDVPGDKRLVAYVTNGGKSPPTAEQLREHLRLVIPGYMLPSAFVVLEHLPLTPNGKLDRRALPMPEVGAWVSREYEAPVGTVEEILASIWQSLLQVERVGRKDNFFELGGHSLLVVQMAERLRRVGLSMSMRLAFESDTLAALATAIATSAREHSIVPPNLIPPRCNRLTPEMLPLVRLEPEHVERIVRLVPGGAANVQDIYPLTPLQEGILFHYLLNEGDADIYLTSTALRLGSRARLDELVAALQAVIDKYDVLRTAILWEQLPQPVQLVCREASLSVGHIEFDSNRDPVEQIKEWIRPERQRMDLRSAPLLRLQVAADASSGDWYAVVQLHHITCDHVALEILVSEVVACLEGRQRPPASEPFRNHVAQVLASDRLHDSQAFFRSKLADLDEPTVPFAVMDVSGGSGMQMVRARRELDSNLAQRVRAHARQLAVSSATLFHAAWAIVAARASGRDDVVFGSVLLGRMYEGSGTQRALGMFLNTLPVRLRLQNATVKNVVEQAQRELVELLSHDQASLAMAQRCSGIAANLPLFTALFNYRHSAPDPQSHWSGARGVQVVAAQSGTNYPITVSVDDLGAGFTLDVQTDHRIDASRVAEYVLTATRSLTDALESGPEKAALSLDILPQSEREELLNRLSGEQAASPREELIHEFVEAQAERTPNAVALLHDDRHITYERLNATANQLARFLLARGVRPGRLVGVCVERSIDMIVALLGILKAGGAYLPLDPNYPADRLTNMLVDAVPQIVLVQDSLRALVPTGHTHPISIESTLGDLDQYGRDNLSQADVGISREDLVYVIYTSGSTGRPKGIAMPHGAMVNLIEWHRRALPLAAGHRVLQFAAISFDVAFQEIFSTLSDGGTLVLLDEYVRRDVRALSDLLRKQRIERLFLPPLMLQNLAEYFVQSGEAARALKDIITAGEQLRISSEIVAVCKSLPSCRLHNHYGPTETHVVTSLTLTGNPGEWPALPTIGRPIANTQIYILDSRHQLVPLGVAGEIYIGGANVARGYLHRPELTAQRFISDPFDTEQRARMYKTGDLGRWRADGTIEYLGRNDAQVKVRGFRVELGEIEAQLCQHPHLKDAVVILREDEPGDRRLVAYVTSRDQTKPNVEELREHLHAKLPDYMVPSAIVALDRLPTTPSGKLDRLGLPAPGCDAYVSRPYEAVRSGTEEMLAGIWRLLLRAERVGRQDNFFELGGESLKAMKLAVKVAEACGVQLPVHLVFRNPTIQQLAAVIEDLRPDQSHDRHPRPEQFEEVSL